MATIKENLIAAKALIADPAKWGKGLTRGAQGKMCAIDALFEVTYKGNGRYFVFERTAAELDRHVPLRFTGPHRQTAQFNDHTATTHADIMALFDRAIAAQDGS